MIDLHSHILPNIDDGSRNIEETFNLIKEAKEAGFEGVISTSHYIEGYYESDVQERTTWIEAISEKLKEKEIDIKIYLGNEVYLSENIIELINQKKVATLNNTKYILFEMPMNIEPMNIYDIVYELLGNKLVPILAHPERYSFVQTNPNLIYELIRKGVLMQSNYGSIIGQYGKKAQIVVKKFLENNMVHFLGSDVHRKETIYTKMSEMLKEIQEIIGTSKLEELNNINPKLVLENKNIEIYEPKEVKFTFKEKIVINRKK